MSTPADPPEAEGPRDDAVFAAEWSLGLLEGEELLAARGKYATDPAFAWRKEWWDNWFAPWTDEMAGAAEPGEHVWQAIAARIATAGPPPVQAAAMAGEIAQLKARLRRWQWATALTSAAAAVALALIAFAPVRAPREAAPQLAAARPMVASVPIGKTGLRLDVTYIPESRTMLVTAIGLRPDGVHDHQLWLVPDDGGAPKSLGVVQPGTVRAMAVPREISAELHAGAQVVLTREPLGGKPAGAQAGPVVAQGTFRGV